MSGKRSAIIANKETGLLPWFRLGKDLNNWSIEIPKGGVTPDWWGEQLIGIELVKFHGSYWISCTHLGRKREGLKVWLN